MEDASENTQEYNTENNRKILSWKAKEQEYHLKSKRSLLIAGGILMAIIIYALVSQSPVMAITFMLIGIVGYIYTNKPSPTHTFSISSEGVHVGTSLYPYENISSFWIFYEPGDLQCISLHTNADLTPYVHIPLGKTDPVEVRDILLQFLPERKHQLQFIDRLLQYF